MSALFPTEEESRKLYPPLGPKAFTNPSPLTLLLMTQQGKYPRVGKVHSAWLHMKDRCTSNKPINRYYRLNNIQVCERWLGSFDAFMDDMGYPPTKEHSLDRIDNLGNYCPENCRWATKTEQARNTNTTFRVTYRGETRPLADWCDELGAKPGTIRARMLLQGLSFEEALTKPVDPKTYTYQGKTLSLKGWAKEVGVDYDTLKSRKRSGWEFPELLVPPRNPLSKKKAPNT